VRNLSAIVASATVLAACAGRPPYLWWSVSGAAGDFADSTSDYCTLVSHVDLRGRMPAEWEGRADLLFARSVFRNGQRQEAGQVRGNATVRLARNGDTVTLTYQSPFVGTLIGSGTEEMFEGDWSCDSSFPLADDSTRAAPGSWMIAPSLDYER